MAESASTAKIKLSDIVRGPRVRTQLNESRIEMFMALYSSGADVPLIELYRGNNELRAGDHRTTAMERLGWQNRMIEFKPVAKPRDNVSMMIDKYADNVDGSQPPTFSDAVFVAKKLLEDGATPAKISREFGKRMGKTYPPSMVRKIMTRARTEFTSEQMQAALSAMASKSLTADQAEKEFKLEPGSLKRVLSKKSKEKPDIEAVKAAMSSRSKSFSRKNGGAVMELLERFAEKSVSAKDVSDVLKHVEYLLGRQTSALTKLRKRFATLGGPKASKAKRKKRRTVRAKGRARKAKSHKGSSRRPAINGTGAHVSA
ncbi:MAG: hypothetical protein KBD06_03115 [Candidatus Pacebacteria bacterium]|nr:hypothetical protein [Candidatus Paceibacterota bacterium]